MLFPFNVFPGLDVSKINLDWIMRKIGVLEEGQKTVEEAAEQATEAATQATNAAEQATEAAESAVSIVETVVSTANEAKTIAQNASNTAGAAQTTANGALAQADIAREEAQAAQADADAIKDYLILSNTGSLVLDPVSGVTVVGVDMRYALNADGTLGKIYGAVVCNFATTNVQYTIPTNVYVATPEAAYNITRCGFGAVASGSNSDLCSYQVGANGRLYLVLGATAASMRYEFYPCLYFFVNLGD